MIQSEKSTKSRLLSVSVALSLAFSSVIPTFTTVYAAGGQETEYIFSAYDESNPAYHYFYDQLNDQSRKIYSAMETMWKEGIFANGEDYDLLQNGYVTENQVKTFVNGNSQLIDDYGAARDAFQYDNPDVFYVDWNTLSVRVTQDSEGTLHCYLGAGRTASYLLSPFTAATIPNAIHDYEARIAEILEGLPTEGKDGDNTLAEEQTLYIHDYITKNMIYRFENEVTDSGCNARTAYDALIYGEGVCEAYTRGFKALMDRAGIPTVCVYGVYRASETAKEMHIWNNVQIDGKWYGVDVTHDDPVGKDWKDKNSSHETREYCLVGELDLNAHHVSSGILSTANYEFTYPALELESLRERSYFINRDLVVKLEEDSYSEDSDEILPSGTILVSYRGKNYTQNAEDGYYILVKYGQYYPESDKWVYSDWSYITPQFYDVSGEGMEPATPDPTMLPKDVTGDEYGEGYYVRLPLPHIMKAQFAVTTIAPTFHYTEETGIEGSLYYEGNASLLNVVSEEIDNRWGTYVKPPYPQTVTPAMNCTMRIGNTYHVTVTFDEVLKEDGSGQGVGLELQQTSNWTGDAITGEIYSKLEHLTWDGKATIQFDFTPSNQYADDNSFYNIQVTGLIGEDSGKKPVVITYGCRYATSFCALKADGFNWHLFGHPQLIDTPDMDTSNWKAVDSTTGKPIENVNITDKITHRLTLVTSEPSPSKSKEMEEVLGTNYENTHFLTTQTYNIQLALCKAMIVETGQAVRVCVGFPDGYSYDSTLNGVTFKAYHYKVDPATNQLTGEVEEIRCIATKLGLIIECDAFSPFAIAAVETDETVTDKTVILTSDINGAFYDGGKKLEGSDGMLTLTPDTTSENAKSVTIKANKGYEITAVTINGNRIPLNDKATEYPITFDYKDYEDAAITVSAEFIADEVAKTDRENGEISVAPSAIPVEIVFDTQEITVKENESFTLTPQITDFGGEHVYQWYKDGNPLSEQMEETLTVASATKEDAGKYALEVTTSLNETSTTAASETVTVVVGDADQPEEDTTEESSQIPTEEPTGQLPQAPTEEPTKQPSQVPTEEPTKQPSQVPAEEPTKQPSQVPAEEPTEQPTTESTKPDMVTGLKVSSSAADKAKLSWNQVSDANGYYVFRYDTQKKTFVQIADVSKVSYTDKKLTAGESYRYKVSAYKKTGSDILAGAQSEEANVIVKPKAPTQLKAKRLTNTTAQISFQGMKGNVQYYIYQYDAKSKKYKLTYRVKSKKLYQYQAKKKKWKKLRKVTQAKAGKVVLKLTGLSSGQSYKYRIRSVVTKSGYKTANSKDSKTVKVPSKK